MSDAQRTVAWLLTPPGRGGIAVVALAGPDAEGILGTCFRARSVDRPSLPQRGQAPAPPRQEAVQQVRRHPEVKGQAHAAVRGPAKLQLGEIVDGDEIIDEALVAAAPRGVEINIHGGPAATRRVLRQLARRGAELSADAPASLLEPAHPCWDNPVIGEELLAALPQAPSRFVAACLTNQWSAGLSELAFEALRVTRGMPALQACSLASKLHRAAGHYATMQMLLDPPEVVLAGPPNAGKSALANVLTGRPVSIVHDTAGTTRDWIREQAILDGRAVWLTDTAGLWNATDGVDSCCQATPRLAEQDAEAVHRAWDRIDAADLAVLCIPADARDDAASNELPALRSSRLIHVPSLTVRTKADLRSAPSVVPASPRGDGADLSSVHHSEFITHHLACSAETSAGLPQLRAAILDALGLADIDPVAPAAFTRRQADLLDRAADAAETGHASAAVACARALLGFD